jgi:3-oxoacyl-[acyl-carrier-protein] synthase III
MRDLAGEADANALSSAGRRTVGGVELTTTTPDRPCPAAAPEVAHRLGLGQVPAFDISTGCSGFVYATTVANGLITSGVVDGVLMASEIYSPIVDPTDRGTAVIFGDGAGAVVLRRGTTAAQGALLAFDLGGDGSGHHLIQVPGELEQPDGPRWFGVAGRKVYLRAVEQMALSASRVLKGCGWSPGMVDALVPHQANGRIIQAVAE